MPSFIKALPVVLLVGAGAIAGPISHPRSTAPSSSMIDGKTLSQKIHGFVMGNRTSARDEVPKPVYDSCTEHTKRERLENQMFKERGVDILSAGKGKDTVYVGETNVLTNKGSASSGDDRTQDSSEGGSTGSKSVIQVDPVTLAKRAISGVDDLNVLSNTQGEDNEANSGRGRDAIGVDQVNVLSNANSATTTSNRGQDLTTITNGNGNGNSGSGNSDSSTVTTNGNGNGNSGSGNSDSSTVTTSGNGNGSGMDSSSVVTVDPITVGGTNNSGFGKNTGSSSVGSSGSGQDSSSVVTVDPITVGGKGTDNSGSGKETGSSSVISVGAITVRSNDNGNSGSGRGKDTSNADD